MGKCGKGTGSFGALSETSLFRLLGQHWRQRLAMGKVTVGYREADHPICRIYILNDVLILQGGWEGEKITCGLLRRRSLSSFLLPLLLLSIARSERLIVIVYVQKIPAIIVDARLSSFLPSLISLSACLDITCIMNE